MTPPGAPLTVLVLAVGGNVSQGILKALQRSTVPCRVLGTDVSAPQMGLYTVERGFVVPWAHEDSFLPSLKRICKAESVDIMLTGCEPVLDFFVAHRAEVEAVTGALCPVNTPETHAICEDKLLTCQWLDAQGFNGPGYAESCDAEAVSALVEAVGYPLIAKPRRGGGSRGLIRVEDADDLAYAMRKPGYLIQESLGDDDHEYTVGCFVDRDGELAGSLVMRRDLVAGTTYRAWVEDNPAVQAESERIATALKAVGPCNVQLRMTERGPVCFEINARFSGTAPIRAALGFNEAEAFLRHFALNEPVTLPRITEGMALRYWNELYVPPAVVNRVTASGISDGLPPGEGGVEPYGMRG